MIASTRRMSHLFAADGKCFVVAMDHAGFRDKPMPGLECPEETIRATVRAGADAFLLTLGSARRGAAALGRAGLWLSVDIQPPYLDRIVETALRAGADGIKCLVYPFASDLPDSMTHFAALAADCHTWGMPVMAEVIPGGWSAGAEMRTPEKIAAGVRVAMEAGADVVKTFYTGTPESFHVVTHYAPVPIVVLGGERATNERELLESVRGALDAGASGVAIGRNIWQHPKPEQIARALAHLIHDNATVDQALANVQ